MDWSQHLETNLPSHKALPQVRKLGKIKILLHAGLIKNLQGFKLRLKHNPRLLKTCHEYLFITTGSHSVKRVESWT